MSKFYVQPQKHLLPASSNSDPVSSTHNSIIVNSSSPPSSKNNPQINSRDLMRLYLRDIGRIPLLTKEQEITLAKQIKKTQDLEQIKSDNQSLPVLEKYIKVMDTYNSLFAYSTLSPSLDKLAIELNMAPAQLQEIITNGKEKWASLADLKVKELERFLALGFRAKQKMINANLRLVVSIAKKYQNRGLELLDLIQEGTLGLEKAVDRFDYTKGYHFSTYAYWWIRQGMTRAIATQSRTIRLPIHITEKLNQLKKVQRKLSQSLGRMAKIDEIALEMEMKPEELRQFLNQIPRSISLEMKVGEDYNTELVELIEADSATPEENLIRTSMQKDLRSILSILNEREQKIVRLRYGFEDGKIYSLSDTARMMNLSRERVRQIQARAIQKLRQPHQKRNLQDYLEIID